MKRTVAGVGLMLGFAASCFGQGVTAPAAAVPAAGAPAVASAPVERDGSFETFSKMVSSANNSPVAAEPGDHQLHWVGPDGRKISLVVKVPHPSATAAVVTVPVVPEGEDARPYFDKALDEVRAKKAGKLVLSRGIYTFKTLGKGGVAQWVVDGLTDVTIDGGGANLVFTLNKNGIGIQNCRRVAFTNFVESFSLKMAALGTVVTQGDQNVLKIDPAYPVTAEDTMGHMSEYDVAHQRLVPNGLRAYAPPGSKEVPKFIGDQTYTSPAFQNKQMPGKTFLVFQQWYGGAAIQIKDPAGPALTEDVIFSNVTINSGPGMGIVAFGMRRGLGIWNSKIVPKEGALVSTEYDALHMMVLGGDISIHDNEISRQGDDGLNINNPLTDVAKIDPDGKSVVLATYSRFMRKGQRIAAFDPSNNYLGTAEIMDEPKSLGGPNNQWYGMTLSKAIPGLTLKSVFRNIDQVNGRIAVVHNSIGHCGCHGVLVQTPNTLVDGNTFDTTSGNAIRLLTNAGFFKEGVGAINVIVRNNTIINSGGDAGLHGVKFAAIAVYGTGSAGVVAAPSNRFIDILNNTIVGAQQACISVMSSMQVNVVGNTCKNTNQAPASHRGASLYVSNSSQIVLKDNKKSDTTGMMGGIEVEAATTKDIQAQSAF